MAHATLAGDLTTVNLDCPSGQGHKIIKLTQNEEGESREPPYLRWNFKKAKWDDYTKQLEESADSCTLTGNPNKDIKLFDDLIKAAARKHIPRGSAKFYRPFWNKRLDELRGERNLCRRAAEQANLSSTKEKLKQAQTALEKAINEEREDKFRQFLKGMDFRKDAIKAHSFFSKLCKGRRSKLPAPVQGQRGHHQCGKGGYAVQIFCNSQHSSA
jgi:hypothetical protein